MMFFFKHINENNKLFYVIDFSFNFQSLLSTIGTIVALHSPYKRSYNSQFKAFICAALKYVTFNCKIS